MVNVKYFLCIVISMNMQHSFCMEQSDTKEVMAVLSEIKTWETIEPFAGYLVAYTTISERLGRGYIIDQDSSIKYGYIEKNPLTREDVQDYTPYQKPAGYTLLPLLNEDQSGYDELTDSSITGANVSMRAATMQEITQIRAAISGNARFGNFFGTYHQSKSNKIIQGCEQLKKKYAQDLAIALLGCYNAHEEKRIPVVYPILPYEMLLHITKFKYGVEDNA